MIEQIHAITITAAGTVASGAAAWLMSVTGDTKIDGPISVTVIFGIGTTVIGLLWRMWRREADTAREREDELRAQISEQKDAEIARLRNQLDKQQQSKGD